MSCHHLQGYVLTNTWGQGLNIAQYSDSVREKQYTRTPCFFPMSSPAVPKLENNMCIEQYSNKKSINQATYIALCTWKHQLCNVTFHINLYISFPSR